MDRSESTLLGGDAVTERDDYERVGGKHNPIGLTLEDMLLLYGAAVERDDFERADLLASRILSYNDPPWVDA